MLKKIGMVSLGCPKNLVDSEIMLGLLDKKKYQITNNKDEADIIIVNTCGFIETARQESINTILEMGRCKKNKCRMLIVTGCLAQRYKQEILLEIPEVDAVLGTGSYSDISGIIEKAFAGERPEAYGETSGTAYLENDRILSTGSGYAYLKIAEGCDNCCTYCVIPSLRGPFRSRKLEDIVKEASKLAQKGVKELILIAQDTTRYGIDIYKKRKLVELLQKISEIDEIQWIRILYCYPEEITDELLDEMANNSKICKYLDIPIQHASDRILKSMGRRSSSKALGELLEKIRSKLPEAVLRTTLITGFPGETEEDFDILTEFVKKYRFDRLGVFMYSKEENTPAAGLKPQLSKKVKKKRHDEIMGIQQHIAKQKNQERLGRQYRVLAEGIADDGIFYYGRSYQEAPDIDGLIYFTSEQPVRIGDFVNIKIHAVKKYDLIGEVKNESAE
ncbi:MAG: 30S ribosomal protein S12 methylthiotransferase RimO [Ruminiclostridium sp.]|nr:30S ribosomal protein S12 methylthiotransferase RimO [Ruminiclostridium sp.]